MDQMMKSELAMDRLKASEERFKLSGAIEGGFILMLVSAIVYALLDISEEIHNLANEITPNH